MTQQGSEEGSGAVARVINGELVLVDPAALEMIIAIEKVNCRTTLDLNADRVAHFKKRAVDRGMSAAEVVIVVINVDDSNGTALAETLMPDANWQVYRDRGEVPFARGLAYKEGVAEYVALFDEAAASKLRGTSDLCALVIDHGVAEVFPA